MNNWPSITFSDVVEVTDYVANGSFEALRNNVTTSSERAFAILVRLMDFNAGWNGPYSYVDEASYSFLTKSSLKQGDVVISNVGANAGTVFRVPDLKMPMTLGPNAVRCRPKEQAQLDLGYLYYFLSSPMGQSLLQGIISGSAQPKFNKTSLRQLPLLLPPLGRQRAIADVLAAVDDKITANTILSATSEDLAISLVSRVEPSIQLGEIVTHRKKTVSPESLPSDFVAHYSLPAFDVGKTPDRVNPFEIKSSKFSIAYPSVLISKLNPRFPRVWDVASVPDIPALASTEFLVLEPVHSSTSVLWATLCQPAFGLALEAKVAGTSGSHQRVKPADLLATPVVDPRVLSDRLRELLGALGTVQSSARDESRKLAAMRDTLLPQLISGNLRVQEAERLVESAL